MTTARRGEGEDGSVGADGEGGGRVSAEVASVTRQVPARSRIPASDEAIVR